MAAKPKPEATGWYVLDLTVIGNWVGKDLTRKAAEKLAKETGEVVRVNDDERRIYIKTAAREEHIHVQSLRG